MVWVHIKNQTSALKTAYLGFLALGILCLLAGGASFSYGTTLSEEIGIGIMSFGGSCVALSGVLAAASNGMERLEEAWGEFRGGVNRKVTAATEKVEGRAKAEAENIVSELVTRNDLENSYVASRRVRAGGGIIGFFDSLFMYVRLFFVSVFVANFQRIEEIKVFGKRRLENAIIDEFTVKMQGAQGISADEKSTAITKFAGQIRNRKGA